MFKDFCHKLLHVIIQSYVKTRDKRQDEMEIQEKLSSLIKQAFEAAINDGSLTMDSNEIPDPALERPRDESNGDWASTVAMRSAKAAHCAPRTIAEAIVAHIPNNELIASAEIAGPGFINFKLANDVLQNVIVKLRSEGKNFGKSDFGAGEKVDLEYVSANPTGPMHVGHGRWAALGSSIANVMRHAGYEVTEEFYVNDHGVQMDVFGNSISVRYMQLLGHDVQMPEQCYGGAYVADIAQSIIDAEGKKYESMTDEERKCEFREIGYKMMLENQRKICASIGTTFDVWFSERTLYVPDKNGKSMVDHAIAAMESKGYIFNKDGAVWFKSSALGDDKDRVLIKANGEMTYFMSDVAYHFNKMQRGFTHLINIWGADHHGYVKRCQCMMEAWGYKDKLEVVLGQLVNLFRNGESVRMSKRTGEMVTLEELIEEVGPDATRYLMLAKSSDQPIDFDIEVAKKKDSSNPVYYVQYAHARICSILRKAAAESGMTEDEIKSLSTDKLAEKLIGENPDLSLLSHESELALMRKMADFKSFIESAAKDRAPYRCTHYVEELASLFHSFYTNCKVIQDDKELEKSRLALCDATRKLIALVLGLLGVSAPERM